MSRSPLLWCAFALLTSAGCAASRTTDVADGERAELLTLSTDRTAAPPDRIRAEQAFVRAMTLVRIGDAAGAVPLFEETLRLVPDDPAVLAALAEAHAALDAYDTAAYYAEAARAAAPDAVYVHRQAAHLYRDAGRTADAADAFAAVVEHAPHDYEALAQLAALRTTLGDDAGARDAYLRLREALGETPEVLNPLVDTYVRLGDPGGAEATLRALVGAAPSDPAPYRMLAELLAGRGALDEAADALRALLRVAPGDREAAAALAALDRRLGTAAAGTDDPRVSAATLLAGDAPAPEALEAAVPALEAIVERAPEDAAALRLLGRIRLLQGAADEGTRLLRRAVETDPRDLDGWTAAAEALLAAGRAEDAAAVADEGLLLFPGQLALLEAAAPAHLAAGDGAAAIDRAQEALRLLETDGASAERRADLLVLIGDAHARLGRGESAREAWRAAAALVPSHGPARERLGADAP